MSTKTDTEEAQVKNPPKQKLGEDDEQVLSDVCGEGAVPDSVVDLYIRIKLLKDRIQPGPMSPEGVAFIVARGELADGKLAPGERVADPLKEE